MTSKTYVFSDMHKGLNINSRGDVEILYDVDAIEQSIKAIMATVSGERVRNPLGSTLVGLLFQPMTSRVVDSMKDEIRRVIRLYEPRVSIRTIEITPDYNKNIYDILLEFDVVGLTGRFNTNTKLKSFGVS